MNNYTDSFINNIIEFSNKQFTVAQTHQAKRCLLDYLGATIAGAQILSEKRSLYIDALGKNIGDVKVIGCGIDTSVERAGFINGLNAHVAELDDGVISGIVHPGSPIFSALIPYAQKENVSGDDFIRGIIVGYEVATSLADAIQPSHKLKGFHATATCGSIGGAMAIASMLHYSIEEMKNALSIAAVSAFGTLKVLEDNSQLKPYNVALAAQISINSVAMAKAGFQGPDDVLNGSRGFFEMLSDEINLDFLTIQKNEVLAIERVYVKPYAACRYCHPGIDAALNLMNKYKVEPETIKSIEVSTYDIAVKHHDHVLVANSSSAKMSIPYSVAVALITNKAGLEQYTDEFIFDDNISSLARKVKVLSNDEFTKLFPKYSPAEIVVETYDGQRFNEKINNPRGEANVPLSDDELKNKFSSLVKFNTIKDFDSAKLIYSVFNLEKEINNIFELI
jgi:2-methylcitrate dehydratase PrpD